MSLLSALGAVLLLPAVTAAAAPTDLDAPFGTGGVTTSAFPQGPTDVAVYGTDVAAQPDGRLVVAGTRVTAGPGYQWLIARYGVDGVLDTGFGSGGRVALNELTTSQGATALLVESGGTIDVTGQRTGGSNAPAQVDRLDANGTPLGTAWTAPVPGSTRTNAQAIAVQPDDGKVIVTGNAFINGNEKVFAARFDTNGTPDTTFDGDGTPDGVYVVPDGACDDVGPASSCTAGGLALHANGGGAVDGIYIGGGTAGDLVGGRVFKLIPSGTEAGFAIDPAYGSAPTPGAARLDRGAVTEAYDLILDGAGGVVIAGYANNALNSYSCGIARVTADGTPDPAFGTGGAGRIDLGGTCVVRDLDVDTQGRFVFAGESTSGIQFGGTESVALGRFTSTGAPDGSFAPGGGVVTSPGASSSFANGLVLQGDKPVITGGAGAPHHVLLARFAGGDADGPVSPQAGPPTNISRPSVTGAALPLKVGDQVTCDPGTWFPAGYAITDYRWQRYVSDAKASLLAAPRPAGAGRTYTVQSADQGNAITCSATAGTAGGSRTTASPLATVRTTIRIPNVRGLPVEVAESRIRAQLDGQVSFGSAAEQRRAGAAKASIPCDFGGLQGKDCPARVRGKIKPGQVFNATPAIGKPVTEAYGAGAKLPKVVLDWYDPAKDRSDDVPKATPRVDCPATASADVRRDFENRLLGHYAQYARDLLSQYHCPFKEVVRQSADQSLDPYVVEVQDAAIAGDRGYRITISVPKVPDLAAAVSHQRLHGRDSFQGADLSRGPLNPGLGEDGKLTVTLGGQKNDLCFNVIETSTGRAVPGALIRAYDATGNEVQDVAGKSEYIRTGSDGHGCGSFTVRRAGDYRFTYTFYGGNGTNEEGGQTIQAIDRGRALWTTISGRQMQCKGDCSQLGFATTRGAGPRANVVDTLVAGLRSLLDGLLRRGSPLVARAGAQEAADADGSPSASLFHAQADNGVSVGLLVVKGTLKPGAVSSSGVVSDNGLGLISNDGGSLTAVRTGSIISNDGGSFVGIATGGAARPAVRGAASVLVTRDGRIISNDGGSLISNDGGSIISDNGGGLISDNGAGLISDNGAGVIAPAGGAVVMVGARAVIARGNGVLAPGTIISQDGGSAIPVGASIISDHGVG